MKLMNGGEQIRRTAIRFRVRIMDKDVEAEQIERNYEERNIN